MKALARRVARDAAILGVAGFGLVFALSFVPATPVSMLEHFRYQLALGGLVVVVGTGVLVFGVHWLHVMWFDLALATLLLDACVVLPDLGAPRRPLPESGAHVRVLLSNVLRASDHYEDLRRLIAEERPDVVALVEPDARWLRELAPVLAEYPARLEAPLPNNFGLALYARGSLTGGVEHLASRFPSLVAEAEVDGARFALVLVHPPPPMRPEAYAGQLETFDAIAARARGFAAPFVILGDFNAAPWSRGYARLLRASGACDSRAGFGLQLSWQGMGWWLRIPIDHALVECAIGVADRRIGPDIGSDHLPVILDLVVPRGAAQPALTQVPQGAGSSAFAR